MKKFLNKYIVCALFMVTAIASCNILLNNNSTSKQENKIPNLVGMGIEDAEQKLMSIGDLKIVKVKDSH